MRSKLLRKVKLQSAMEYLMTYGWAILIIAVVLGVLFQMGVFSSSSLSVRALPGACKVLRTSAAVNLVGQCSGILPKYVAMFDGQSSNVRAPKIFTSPTFTYAAWISPASITGTQGIISNYGYTSGGIVLEIASNKVATKWVDSLLAVHEGAVGPTLQSGRWYFVALTFDGTNMLLYLNNTQYTVSSSTSIITMTDPYYGPFIGEQRYNANFFNGMISNAQIYNTSLDASSISTLYQEGMGGAPVNPQYLVGWWPLNGDANDYGGNNNGAPTAITYVSQYGK